MRNDRWGRRGSTEEKRRGGSRAEQEEEEEEVEVEEEEEEKKRRKEAEKKRARKRARKEGPAARTSSPPRTRIERARRRPLYVVKVGPCSCRKAVTLVGCIIPLRARYMTTLPLCSSTAAALLPHGVNKDERIVRARVLPRGEFIKPYRFARRMKNGNSAD